MGQGHGWQGTVLKLLRARDFTFTVTGAEDVTATYRRVHLTDGGMLAATGVHPTMWVRLWFEHAGKPHQRAYTLVDPDPEAGTFRLEFALHEGVASDWARSAAPGATVEATVHGTGFERPAPEPSRLIAIGDPASLPAINSLLAAFPTTPTTLFFEGSLTNLPLASRPDVHEIPRGALLDRLRTDLPPLLDPDTYIWIACDTTTTRALSAYVRKELSFPKHRVHALGYWQAK
ncbi:siderophore-interacting protein [Streptomyces sp. NPDC028635]|uniref:siderophore-interacting protein n=1 Tax=Streptomyces sp. NPDC028635 TaxID=3154800 RepID=UPI0033E0085C